MRKGRVKELSFLFLHFYASWYSFVYYFCPRGKIMSGLRTCARFESMAPSRQERPTFSSTSASSHVPMAVTSETMICRRRRRRRAPHVNVTFCKSSVCVCAWKMLGPSRVKGATLRLSRDFAPQYTIFFFCARIRKCQQPAAVCEKWRVRCSVIDSRANIVT